MPLSAGPRRRLTPILGGSREGAKPAASALVLGRDLLESPIATLIGDIQE
ncbi:MAG: hypothetical protein AAF481_01295 [Acidobacteriota bacterium]